MYLIILTQSAIKQVPEATIVYNKQGEGSSSEDGSFRLGMQGQGGEPSSGGEIGE